MTDFTNNKNGLLYVKNNIEITEELQLLRNEINELKKENIGLAKKIKVNTTGRADNRKNIAEIKSLIRAADPRKIAGVLLGNFADIRFIHSKCKSLMTRITVATEILSWSKDNRPELATNVISAFDESDEWWNVKDNYTIKKWIMVINKLAKEKQKV